jgi:glutathione S-transferase
VLKIWGRVNSVNVKKVLWCAEELALPYQRIDAGREHGVVDSDEYRKLNPNGLVPTIEEDGFMLWESHSIVRYLSAKHGAGTLWPADLRQRADAERWMDWAFTFSAAVRPMFWGLVRTPPEKRDLKAIEDSRKRCAELIPIVDAALAGRRFLTGDSFTIGDIPLGCHLQVWFNLPIDRPAAPNAEGWFQRLCDRSAYRKVVTIPLS